MNGTEPVVTDPNNSTDGYDPFRYQPEAPVPYWHQDMELAFICIFNAMTLLLIVARVAIRTMRLGKFRKDDTWLMCAGIILVFPYWVCQIGTNRYGSGLHAWNLPDSYLAPFFHFEIGWVGYYIVASMIKVSVLYGMLQILPPAFFKMRLFCHILSGAILALGVAESCIWIFQCQPFLSNFDYSVAQAWCMNIDAARYAWVGISVFFDLCMVSVPFAIIRQIRLERYERIILFAVFGANLMGTMACAAGAYGIWVNNNTSAAVDDSFTESIFIMTTDVELFLYALGASATIPSKYLISRAKNLSQRSGSRESDWRSNISWPTSNESYYTHTTPNPASAKSPRSPSSRRGFGSFGLKRGFKGSDVEILEGFDLQVSPKSSTASAATPRSHHGFFGASNTGGRKKSSIASISRPILGADSPRNPSAPDLMDVGGLINTAAPPAGSSAAAAAARGTRPQPHRLITSPEALRRPSGASPLSSHAYTHSHGQTAVPFENIDWSAAAANHQNRYQHQRTPTDASLEQLQPVAWERSGPINGWNA